MRCLKPMVHTLSSTARRIGPTRCPRVGHSGPAQPLDFTGCSPWVWVARPAAVPRDRRRGRDRWCQPDRAATSDDSRTQAEERARACEGHRDVQPEGWRRKDDVDDQSGCQPGRVRPPCAAGRPRPAGRAVGRARGAALRAGPHGAQPSRRPAGVDRRGIDQDPCQGPRPGAQQHRSVRRRDPTGQRGRPRAVVGAGASSGAGPLRLRPDRLPALARDCSPSTAWPARTASSFPPSASTSRCAVWRS